MSRKRNFDDVYGGAGLGDEFVDDILTGKISLNDFSTVHLLGMLRSYDGRENTTLNAELKKVLATREHIPTKEQSKAARKAKAHAQRNR